MAPEAENVKHASDSEWETVAEESGSPLTFDEVGAQFIGTFKGTKHIVPPNAQKEEDEFDQLVFTDEAGDTRTVNAGYKLLEAFGEIAEGSKVRITRTPDVDMNDPGKNPMKDYRVEVAKK